MCMNAMTPVPSKAYGIQKVLNNFEGTTEEGGRCIPLNTKQFGKDIGSIVSSVVALGPGSSESSEQKSRAVIR